MADNFFKKFFIRVKSLSGIFYDTVGNFFSSADIILLSEGFDWVTYEEAKSIKRVLETKGLAKVRISTSGFALRKKVVHFLSENILVRKERIMYTKKTNGFILSWFHISQDDIYRTPVIPKLNERVDYIHTASEITKLKLMHYGAKEENIVKIPLDVNLELFAPLSPEEKQKQRELMGLPSDKFLIGSFQKDGNGWGEGITPKLIKGPDVFCDAVELIAQNQVVHVLLTGPARGYVKSRLQKANIPFTHLYLPDYSSVAKYLAVLDLYIVASREEGGPKAVLESLASGVPFISTRVGMVPEIITHGENGYLTEVEDASAIAKYAKLLLEDPQKQASLRQNGLKTAQAYGTEQMALRMFTELYKPLLDQIRRSDTSR